MRYGAPYMGSKNRIAEDIIKFLPGSDTLVDLFAGGCAITHCAALSGKWNRIIANDIADIIELVQDAISGKIQQRRKEFITKEQFFMEKDHDPFIRYCWSFGNGGVSYLYGDDIVEYKKLLHNVYAADDLDECKRGVKALLRYFSSKNQVFSDEKHAGNLPQALECLTRLKRLQGLESLERLQGLESLERLQGLQLDFSHLDYQAVQIPNGATVYCDIPYQTQAQIDRGGSYVDGFDRDRFIEWAITRDFPVYVSEYNLPEEYFTSVWAKTSNQTYAPQNNSKFVLEKIFVQNKFAGDCKATGNLF